VIFTSGHFETMENITVNAHCSLTIDHFKPTVNKIDHLDIKTFGEMKITTDREALTTIFLLDFGTVVTAWYCGISNI
jgi:hypothetical protein